MRVIAIALLGIFLAACGGGGNGSSAPETGTFTLGITDATIDDYQEALLEVSSITLIGSGGQETSVLDTPQIIDLLKLRNVSEVLLRKSLTARTISKIRLGVESITLNKLEDGSIVESDSPAVPTRKIDLNPQGTLQIRAGEDLFVMLDVDLKNSVKVHENGNGQIKFRPLVKLSAGVSGLVRLYGTYTVDGNDVSVCELERVSDADGVYDVLDMCVALETSNASYFGSDANPLAAGDLADGEKVSVYGHYQQTSNGDVLAAEIIARGTGTRGAAFTTLNGIAASNWDSDTRRYDLALAANDEVLPNDVIPVELPDGAKVFDLDGVLLDPTAITADPMQRRTEARGALTDLLDAEPDWLRAFVVFVTGEGANDVTAGIVVINDGSTLMLDMEADPICVTTDADTEFFDISTGGDVTDTREIALVDIVPDDTIEASGDRVGDCIQADTVIREAAAP